MAFLRKIVESRTTISYTSLLPASLLVLHRHLSIKLFVGGLSFQTNQEGLAEAFSKYGQVIEAKVVTNRVSEKSKGFGFVTFASDEEAHTAVEEMNGKSLNGRVIFVDYAKPETSFRSDIPLARGPPEPVSTPET